MGLPRTPLRYIGCTESGSDLAQRAQVQSATPLSGSYLHGRPMNVFTDLTLPGFRPAMQAEGSRLDLAAQRSGGSVLLPIRPCHRACAGLTPGAVYLSFSAGTHEGSQYLLSWAARRLVMASTDVVDDQGFTGLG